MIPLVLMAGFLGAGKTRFLTELIPRLHAHGVRVRVVLNDFENATIDAARLADLEAVVTPLNGECVCCGSLRELMDTLAAVPPDPGSIMLIEANGATEADELLGYLTLEARLAHFTLPLQLTVIDAGRWQKRWWSNALEAAQTVTATHVLLNWTERLSAARLRVVEESVRRVNAGALFTTVDAFADQLVALTAQVRYVATRDDAPLRAQVRSHERAEGTTHRHPFASLALPLPALVEREAFLNFVRALPAAVVRAKGLVRFHDRAHDMFVWNRVPGRKRVQLDASSPHAKAHPTALFIGGQLPVSELAARIAQLDLHPVAPTRP